MSETAPIYPTLHVAPKTGDENLHRDGRVLESRLLDFWRWSSSDLMSNATRGVLAEWIVARALGITRTVRVEWDAFDLRSPDGISIEVKSGAYLQSWAQTKLSAIRFDIRPTRLEYERSEAKRRAQVYVFCVLTHQDQATVDPLNLEQWEFYVISSESLDLAFGTQKTVALSVLLDKPVLKANFDEIAA